MDDFSQGWTARRRAELFTPPADRPARDPRRVTLSLTSLEDRNAPGELRAAFDPLAGAAVALAASQSVRPVESATLIATARPARLDLDPQFGLALAEATPRGDFVRVAGSRPDLTAENTGAAVSAPRSPTSVAQDNLVGADGGGARSSSANSEAGPSASYYGSGGGNAGPSASYYGSGGGDDGSGGGDDGSGSGSYGSGSGSGSGSGTGTECTPDPNYTWGTFILGDRVWEDRNANGSQDDGEPGIGGVQVAAYHANGDLYGYDTTQSDGHYHFHLSGDGSHQFYIQVSIPAGYVATCQNMLGVPDDKDSDIAANGKSDVFGMGPLLRDSPCGSPYYKDSTIDAGLFKPAGIGDKVWDDLDGNGRQDAGEPGIEGVKVKLGDIGGSPVVGACNQKVLPQFTDPVGRYGFADLVAGTYTVRFTNPDTRAMWFTTPGTLANQPDDSDAFPDDTPHTTATTEPFSLEYGEYRSDIDAGLVSTQAINLTADNDVDGDFDSADDAIENDSLGKLILANADDDDPTGDGLFVADRDQFGHVEGEDDLAEFRLDVPQVDDPEYDGWSVRLMTEGGSASDIRIWSEPQKGTEVAFGKAFVFGTDEVPSSLYVEGINHAVVQLVLMLQNPQGQVKAQNAAKARVFGLELDVNENQTTTDAVDGFANYRPGYVGNNPVLSAGPYNATVFAPQTSGLVFNGLGTDSGIETIGIPLGAAGRTVSFFDGFSENTTASGTGALDEDFATRALHAVAAYSWIDLQARDYGGLAQYVFIAKDATETDRYKSPSPQQVVRDTDHDGMQDGWEREQVLAYHALHGGTVPADVLGFFQVDQVVLASDEPADPDGVGPQVAHKTPGDSLTPNQEYRGYVLDGGGFDGAGANGHQGGHKRLSPVYKELLLEVDAMAGVAAMPTAAQLAAVLETVAKGYSDANNGAGIRVYWVMDESAATHEIFASDVTERTWASTHSNGQLGEFVHLIFADAEWRALYGVTKLQTTDEGGAFVFTTAIQTAAPGADYGAWLANTAAHELGHTIIFIQAQGAPRFGTDQHVNDPDEDNVIEGPGDLKYLMVRGGIRTPRTAIIFSNPSRRQIDLTYKFSVNQ